MIEILIKPMTEDGKYRVTSGSNRLDITQNELGELMEELTVEEPLLLDSLRKCYQLFEVEKFTFKDK